MSAWKLASSPSPAAEFWSDFLKFSSVFCICFLSSFLFQPYTGIEAERFTYLEVKDSAENYMIFASG